MLTRLFRSLRLGSSPKPTMPAGCPRRSFMPRLELLEGRDLPSTLTVTNLGDTGALGDGSLRGEIAATQAGDTINFQPGLAGTIALTGGQLTINQSLTINGPGAGQVAISGNHADRVFDFAKGTTDGLAGLTIENGSVNWMSAGGANGGGIANFGTLTVQACTISYNYVAGMDMGFGGGIYNQGTLTINSSTITNNTANGFAGGGWGGGIMNNEGLPTVVRGRPGRMATVVTITNCTLSGNTADCGGGIANYPVLQAQVTINSSTIAGNTGNYLGGGIDNGGALALSNSTVFGNTANEGGGISTDAVIGSPVTIGNCTISGNTANVLGGGIDNGGGIYYTYALNLRNTILAGNSTIAGASDLTGNPTSSGYNLVGYTGNLSGFAATDLLNVNPDLGPLQNNGGPTQTMALLPGSPAVNAGDPNFTGLSYDQRGPGYPRITGGGMDIGAFEIQSTTPQFMVSAPVSLTAGTPFSLTVEATNSSATVLTGYTGTVHFTSSDPEAVLPADYTFTAADAGVHTFSTTLKTAGTQQIMATDTTTATMTGAGSGIVVQPASTSHFLVTAPTSVAAGSAFGITVTALDPYNNLVTGYTGTVHFTSQDPGALLPANYTYTSADNGAHTFSRVSLKTVGNETITATDTTSSSVSGTAAVAVKPLLVVASFPSPVTAGVAGSFAVSAVDGFGSVVAGYAGTIHFTSTDAQAVLPADYTFTPADQGLHRFTATIKTAGTPSITATDMGTSLTIGAQAGITVQPTAANHFRVTVFGRAVAGYAFRIAVTALDPYGNVATGYTGTVHFSSTDTLATLPPDYTFTPADRGVHNFYPAYGVTFRTKGKQTLTVTDTAGLFSGSVMVVVN